MLNLILQRLRASNGFNKPSHLSHREHYLSGKGYPKTIAGEAQAMLRDCENLNDVLGFEIHLPLSMKEDPAFMRKFNRRKDFFISAEMMEQSTGLNRLYFLRTLLPSPKHKYYYDLTVLINSHQKAQA